MTNPTEKPGQSKEQLERQIREKVERDKAGKKPASDGGDLPPQGDITPQGGVTDNSQRS